MSLDGCSLSGPSYPGRECSQWPRQLPSSLTAKQSREGSIRKTQRLIWTFLRITGWWVNTNNQISGVTGVSQVPAVWMNVELQRDWRGIKWEWTQDIYSDKLGEYSKPFQVWYMKLTTLELNQLFNLLLYSVFKRQMILNVSYWKACALFHS